MKKNRQEKLLELISRYEIDTQDELIGRLREHGFDVTQATISRDIRELKIAKMMTGRGVYRYVLPKQTDNRGGFAFNPALVDAVISVDSALNTVVLKTSPGLAQAVAVGIDRLDTQQILGCVAGDDTILIVTRDTECAEMISDRIRELMKNI